MIHRAIPFYLHDLGAAEIDSLSTVLRGPILTTGETVVEFERRFSSYLGVSHTIGVTSWTGGAHLALLELGIGPGDEVITAPFTFISSAWGINYVGAKPVFADVEEGTFNLDPAKVAAIEYDPNRSANIALLHYADGEKRYILHPIGLKVGDTIVSGPQVDILPGNCLPLRNIPLGTLIHNVELKPGKGGQIARSAGSSIASSTARCRTV